MLNKMILAVNYGVLAVKNKAYAILAGLGEVNDHKGESFEDVIQKPVNKALDLLLWGVSIGGIVSAIMGFLDLKDALSTEGAPATKKKTAIIKILFGVIGTAMGLLLQFLGVTK